MVLPNDKAQSPRLDLSGQTVNVVQHDVLDESNGTNGRSGSSDEVNEFTNPDHRADQTPTMRHAAWYDVFTPSRAARNNNGDHGESGSGSSSASVAQNTSNGHSNSTSSRNFSSNSHSFGRFGYMIPDFKARSTEMWNRAPSVDQVFGGPLTFAMSSASTSMYTHDTMAYSRPLRSWKPSLVGFALLVDLLTAVVTILSTQEVTSSCSPEGRFVYQLLVTFGAGFDVLLHTRWSRYHNSIAEKGGPAQWYGHGMKFLTVFTQILFVTFAALVCFVFRTTNACRLMNFDLWWIALVQLVSFSLQILYSVINFAISLYDFSYRPETIENLVESRELLRFAKYALLRLTPSVAILAFFVVTVVTAPTGTATGAPPPTGGIPAFTEEPLKAISEFGHEYANALVGLVLVTFLVLDTGYVVFGHREDWIKRTLTNRPAWTPIALSILFILFAWYVLLVPQPFFADRFFYADVGVLSLFSIFIAGLLYRLLLKEPDEYGGFYDFAEQQPLMQEEPMPEPEFTTIARPAGAAF
ncbi:unnamed protein product [Amoebophrya sp. A120]|nr:unnamed protein product [Amoebophrya sp. A120]|eukprot:GSA120T00002268001.1